jgi:hypothetical protein
MLSALLCSLTTVTDLPTREAALSAPVVEGVSVTVADLPPAFSITTVFFSASKDFKVPSSVTFFPHPAWALTAKEVRERSAIRVFILGAFDFGVFCVCGLWWEHKSPTL